MIGRRIGRKDRSEMTLRVVGAGVGRTGTTSLKAALERLLGAPCYHMVETFGRPQDRLVWKRAFEGAPPDWHELFQGYAATVDWPAAGLWESIHAAFPDALVLLSVRDVDAWWRSASDTIFASMARNEPRPGSERTEADGMAEAMMASFTPDYLDEAAAKAAFVAHNDHVRATVDPAQLLEWTSADGWAPLAEALGVPTPDEPFPHANTSEQFRAISGLDR
jgi:hypothetical protein